MLQFEQGMTRLVGVAGLFGCSTRPALALDESRSGRGYGYFRKLLHTGPLFNLAAEGSAV
jgi:hypothetical protein